MLVDMRKKICLKKYRNKIKDLQNSKASVSRPFVINKLMKLDTMTSSAYSGNSADEEWLKIEYQMCHAGYNSRDAITEDLFAKAVQVFSVFLTVIVAISAFVKINYNLHIFLCIIIGLAGLISMIAILIDLQSASSCKIALRKRCEVIEVMIEDMNTSNYWEVISKRERYLEEKTYKDIISKLKSTAVGTKVSDVEGDLYIYATRTLIGLWLGLVTAMIIYGDKISIISK
jgi:hypothetical protein